MHKKRFCDVKETMMGNCHLIRPYLGILCIITQNSSALLSWVGGMKSMQFAYVSKLYQVRPYRFLGESDELEKRRRSLTRPSNFTATRGGILVTTKAKKLESNQTAIEATSRQLQNSSSQEQMEGVKQDQKGKFASHHDPKSENLDKESISSSDKHPDSMRLSANATSGKNKKPSTTARPRRSTLTDKQAILEEGLRMRPIGVIRSVYRLCVGTPRQGLLAPNARGCIDLFTLGNSSPARSVEGLEGYSHIWIIFVFHLNTQSEDASKRVKSKVSPPALGGDRVGIFATRSPHRFNPIGMTLCKLDRVEHVDKRNVKLHVSGLDLVDGTPVLDIKPYVPVYDSVATRVGSSGGGVVVPDWVEGGLSLKRVVKISDSAKADLQAILTKDLRALEFYGPDHGEATVADTMKAVMKCIKDVLAIDVRSSFQTKKSRAGSFRAERSDRLSRASSFTPRGQQENRVDDIDATSGSLCTQQIDNLLVHFSIQEGGDSENAASSNSGAQDILDVRSMELFLVDGQRRRRGVDEI